MLGQLDKRAISAVRIQDVVTTLSQLDRFMERNAWLAQANRYATNPIGKIIDDERKNLAPNSPQMADYIVASCLLHCSDGWSYLGRALLSLLRGDPHRAVHLAYYAELRAACAVMATQGIGVFNRAHFVMNGAGSARRLRANTGTHIFAWDSLEYWSTLQRSGVLFAQCVRPFGLSLENWLGPVGGSTIVAAQAQLWFQQWGMDLRLLPDDRKARNLSSYQPDGLPTSWILDAKPTIEFVKELWLALEPSATSSFEVIDRHILRLSLESAHKSRATRRPFKDFLKEILDALGQPVDEAQWMAFMTRAAAAEDIQLLRRSKESSRSSNTTHLAVISRAVLLLRIASGSTSRAFTDADHSLGDSQFWWKALGNSRGIYDGDIEGDDLQLLWSDVINHLDDLENYQNDTAADAQTFYDIGRRLGQVILGLGSCERVTLWSMAT